MPQSMPHPADFRVVGGNLYERIQQSARRSLLAEFRVTENLAAIGYAVRGVNRHESYQAIAGVGSENQAVGVRQHSRHPVTEGFRIGAFSAHISDTPLPVEVNIVAVGDKVLYVTDRLDAKGRQCAQNLTALPLQRFQVVSHRIGNFVGDDSTIALRPCRHHVVISAQSQPRVGCANARQEPGSHGGWLIKEWLYLAPPRPV